MNSGYTVFLQLLQKRDPAVVRMCNASAAALKEGGNVEILAKCKFTLIRFSDTRVEQ